MPKRISVIRLNCLLHQVFPLQRTANETVAYNHLINELEGLHGDEQLFDLCVGILRDLLQRHEDSKVRNDP